jgi:hypothetical protein
MDTDLRQTNQATIEIIYIFGNSIVFGIGAEDSETICSNLQKLINCFLMKIIILVIVL